MGAEAVRPGGGSCCRPQAALAQRSIAELLQEGRVEDVLEHLDAPEPDHDLSGGRAERQSRFDPETSAPSSGPPRRGRRPSRAGQASLPKKSGGSPALLEGRRRPRRPTPPADRGEDPASGSAPTREIRRSVIADVRRRPRKGADGLYLGVRTGSRPSTRRSNAWAGFSSAATTFWRRSGSG